MTGKIIVATDGSNIGSRAVDFAAALSEKFGENLCVLHVLMHARPRKERIRTDRRGRRPCGATCPRRGDHKISISVALCECC